LVSEGSSNRAVRGNPGVGEGGFARYWPEPVEARRPDGEVSLAIDFGCLEYPMTGVFG
jgi:hypothetical protein